MPRSMLGGAWGGVKTADPALRHVESGRQGLDPGICFPHPSPCQQAQGSPTCTRLHRGPWASLKMLGRGLGWEDGSAPPAPAPRGYSQGAPANGWPSGGGLDKCSEVSRCYRGQGAELLVTEHPPLTSCPGPVSHARGDVCVCPSCSLKAMPASSSPGPATACPWLVSSTLVPLGLCVGGGCLWHC